MFMRAFRCKDGRRGAIRQAKADDAQSLIAAIDQVSREGGYFLRSRFVHNVEVERELICRSPRLGNLFLVATIGEDLVGWLTLMRRPQEFRRHAAELGIGVLSAHRDLGIGRALLLSGIDWASTSTLERIELNVRASNQRARELYRRLGFAQEGCRIRAVKDHQGHYDDLILMAYALPQDRKAGADHPARGRGAP